MSARRPLIALVGTALLLLPWWTPPSAPPEISAGVAPTPATPRQKLVADPVPRAPVARMGITRYRTLSEYPLSAMSPDGRTLAFLASEKEVAIMDMATGLVTRRLPVPKERDPSPDLVEGLACSPDGKRVALARFRGVTVLDVESGAVVCRVPARAGLLGDVRSSGYISFSADGSRIAVGGRFHGPNEAVVWDVNADKSVAAVKPLQNLRVYVSLSADGKTLATWGEHEVPPKPGRVTETGSSRPVQIWDVDRQAVQTQLKPSGDAVAAALSPDGRVLAVSGPIGPVQLIDVITGRQVQKFPCRKWVQGLTFSADGKRVAVLTVDGAVPEATVHVWDVAADKQVGTLESSAGQISGVVFPGDRAVAWAVRAGLVTLWEVPSGKRLTPLEGHGSAVNSITFTPDGKTILSASGDRQVIEWNPAAREIRATTLPVPATHPAAFGMAGHKGASVLSPRGSHVLVFDDLRYTYRNGLHVAPPGPTVFEKASGRAVATLPRRDGDYFATTPVRFSADGSRVIALPAEWIHRKGEPSRMPVWDVVTGRTVAEVPVERRGIPGGFAAALSPDGTRLVTVVNRQSLDRTPRRGPDRELMVTGWDLRTGRKLGEFIQPRDVTYSLTVTAADNSTAVIVSHGTVWAVDYARGLPGVEFDHVAPEREWRLRQGHCAPVFSPDGRLLAVGAQTGEPGGCQVRVYEWPEGRLLRTLTGPEAPVTCLAFSPDGKTLAAGSLDTTVLLWDLAAK